MLSAHASMTPCPALCEFLFLYVQEMISRECCPHLLDHGHLDVSGIHVDRHVAALDCAEHADEGTACIAGALAARPEALANRPVLVQGCGRVQGLELGLNPISMHSCKRDKD